jgi:predicted benzoate:H+ symporter BenE
MDVLENVAATAIPLWLLFGPALLIVSSGRLRGVPKLLWTLGALAPPTLAVAGVASIVLIFPQIQINPHADFPPVYFGSVLAVWVVYVIYRRRYVVETTPNSTIERDARKNGARPSL